MLGLVFLFCFAALNGTKQTTMPVLTIGLEDIRQMIRFLDNHPRLTQTLIFIVFVAFIVLAGMVLSITPVS